MKKFLQAVIVLGLSALIMSCASKPKSENKNPIAAEPEYTRDSGTIMDQNWEKYFNTGDEIYLENIIAYVNTEDLLLKTINEQYNKVSADRDFVAAMNLLEVEEQDGAFNCVFDLEMLSAYMIQMDEYKDAILYIYSLFPEDLFIRGVMKTTAFWSLVSNAEQNEDINIALQKHLPYLLEKVQINFYSFLKLEEDIVFIKSDDGVAAFQNDNMQVSFALVNDINQAIDAWNNVPENETPKIRATAIVDSENNTIAPFVIYHCKNQQNFPVLYDVELIKPDETVSSDKGLKIPLIENKPDRDLYFIPSKFYSWSFDKKDKKGTYTVRITVHTTTKVIAVLEMDFVKE